jgi:hypothetical protein
VQQYSLRSAEVQHEARTSRWQPKITACTATLITDTNPNGSQLDRELSGQFTLSLTLPTVHADANTERCFEMKGRRGDLKIASMMHKPVNYVHTSCC